MARKSAAAKAAEAAKAVDETVVGAIATPAPVAPAEEVEETSGVATVTWNGGVRAFSKAIHGKEYKALAKQFAEKFGGKLV